VRLATCAKSGISASADPIFGGRGQVVGYLRYSANANGIPVGPTAPLRPATPITPMAALPLITPMAALPLITPMAALPLITPMAALRPPTPRASGDPNTTGARRREAKG
jgi:hypothetical protein